MAHECGAWAWHRCVVLAHRRAHKCADGHLLILSVCRYGAGARVRSGNCVSSSRLSGSIKLYRCGLIQNLFGFPSIADELLQEEEAQEHVVTLPPCLRQPRIFMPQAFLGGMRDSDMQTRFRLTRGAVLYLYGLLEDKLVPATS